VTGLPFLPAYTFLPLFALPLQAQGAPAAPPPCATTENHLVA